MKRGKKREQGRFSARRKAAAVVRLIKGEDLDTLSRELGVTAATLSDWRERFQRGGEANLKSREPTEADEEALRLKAMVGELTMKNELLVRRAEAAEANHPLAAWRSRR
jgi:transposase-like protein